MTKYKITNNIKTECTAEEEAELNALNVEWTKNKNARITAETEKTNNKTKIKRLGIK
jgi:hypothetical protein